MDTYADRLTALGFIFKDLCPGLFGIEHTDDLNALDLSALQAMFREDIFLPLTKTLYLEMKKYKKEDADSDLKALFSGIINKKARWWLANDRGYRIYLYDCGCPDSSRDRSKELIRDFYRHCCIRL